MKAFAVLLATSLIISILFSCSEKGDKNPAGPENETFSISGKIVKIEMSYGLSNVGITITGNNMSVTIMTDRFGEFMLTDLPMGIYTIIPSSDVYMFGPKERRITVETDQYRVDDFIGVKMEENQYTIAGKIVDTEENPVYSVCFDFISPEGDYVVSCTNTSGYYGYNYSSDDWPFIKGESYRVIPRHPDNDYIFSPDTCYVTIRENITLCNFIAEYTGPPLYKISGRVVDYKGEGMYRLPVVLVEEFPFIRLFNTDKNGFYDFYGLKDGTYILKYEHHSYTFTPQRITVEVDGNDVLIPDVIVWNDSTYYNVSAKMTDTDGKAISDVSVNVYKIGFYKKYLEHELKTGSDGTFSCEVFVHRNAAKSTFRFIPQKDGFSFNPDSTDVTLQWIEFETQGEDVILPGFIGHDHTFITATDYFPLETETSWTYIRTDNENEPFEFTVNVTGTISHNGQIYHHLSEPGPWNFTDFRIEDNSVYAFSYDKDVLFLKFGVVPGTRWESGVIAGTYTRKGKFIGTETVETPAGIFENCVHIEIKVVYGETSYDSYDLWYAPGVGLVRSVKIVENYGRRLEYVVDELKEYEIP